MKNTIFFIVALYICGAQANVDDLLYYPKKGEAAGETAIESLSSELSGSVNGVKVVSSGNYSYLSQKFGLGLSDSFAVALLVKDVTSSSSELKIGSTKFTSDLKNGIQSPTIVFGNRFKYSSEDYLKFNFIDVSVFINPKGSDDNALRSDYMGLELLTGAKLAESNQVSVSLVYTNNNANASNESDSETDLNLNYQNQINDGLFVQLGGTLASLSATKYKSSGDSISYSNSYSLKLAVGGEVNKSILDWRIAYTYVRSSADYTSGATKLSGDLSGGTFSVSLGYILN